MPFNLAKIRRFLATVLLILMVVTNTACASGSQTEVSNLTLDPTQTYTQLEKGNTLAGQTFGDWVVSTSNGLIQDAYVRDNNKLGVVISPQVRPTEVRLLAKSLLMGFHKNFANQDLTVYIYAPDKQRILTANYDRQSNQIDYQA